MSLLRFEPKNFDSESRTLTTRLQKLVELRLEKKENINCQDQGEIYSSSYSTKENKFLGILVLNGPTETSLSSSVYMPLVYLYFKVGLNYIE